MNQVLNYFDITTLSVSSSCYTTSASQYPGGNYTTTTLSSSERAMIKEAMEPILRQRQFVVGPEKDGNLYSGFASVRLGGDPQPPDLIDTHKYRISSNNAPFRKRVVNGEIVLSPLQVGETKVTRSAGLVLSGSRVSLGTYTLDFRLTNLFSELHPGRFYLKGTRKFVQIQSNALIESRRYYGPFAWVYPTFHSAASLSTAIRNSFVIDNDFAIEALADANRRHIDALTEAAELPKTLAMVLDSIGAIASMIRDLKKGRISVSKVRDNAIKHARLTAQDLKLIAKSKRDASLLTARNARRIQTIEYRYRKKVASIDKKWAKQQRQAQADYLTSMSNLWLQFRYGVMPVVYTAEAALDVIAQQSSQYVTTRKFTSRTIEVELPSYWGFPLSNLTFDVNHRAFIKDRYDVGLSKGFSFNPLATAWELLPLSFVVDWFINIGDTIAALTGRFSQDRNSMYIFKSTGNHTIHDANGGQVVVTSSIYDGQLYDFRLCGGLSLRPNLNWKRGFDALAITWSLQRSNIRRNL